MSEAAISQAIVSKLADSLSNGSPGFPNIGDLIPSTLISSAVAAAATQSPESTDSSQAAVPGSIKRDDQDNTVDAVEDLFSDVLEKLLQLIGSSSKDQDKVLKEVAQELSKVLVNNSHNETVDLSSILQAVEPIISQLI
jgi:hypothetical protein